MTMSYQQETYENEKRTLRRLVFAFTAAAIALWPASYAISGHGSDGADWMNFTTAFVWIAAAACSVGSALTTVFLLSMNPPASGSNS